MKWVLVVLVGLIMGANRPTTRPTLIDIKPLQQKVAQAQENVTKATREAKAKWEASDECRRLTADLERRTRERDAAKAGEDLQARLDTAKAYNDARIALEEAGEKAVATDDGLVAAQKASRQAKSDLTDAEKANQGRLEADPIYQAIKRHRVVVGMTLEEVRKATENKGAIEREIEGDVRLYHFVRYYRPDETFTTGHYDYFVWFRGEEAVECRMEYTSPQPIR
jgi:hypothetical protein